MLTRDRFFVTSDSFRPVGIIAGRHLPVNMAAMALITLMTDYGTADHYVAVLKGVIRTLARNAEVIDVTHDVPAFNIQHAAFTLRQVWGWFPKGTIHLAVVDPGVGTARRLLAGQYDDRYVVAPDNGLITFVHRDRKCQSLHLIENPRYRLPVVSTTFHGRDILAPAAAHLANGVKPRELGRVADRIELLSVPPRALASGQGLRGRILHADRFGNLISNIRVEQLSAPRLHQRPWSVQVNGVAIGPIRATFSDVSTGEPVAYVGSGGTLEIAIREGSAVDRFGAIEKIEIDVT